MTDHAHALARQLRWARQMLATSWNSKHPEKPFSETVSAVDIDKALAAYDSQPQISADEIVTSLCRRFKDWSKRGFGPEDVTWCEVKAEIEHLIALSRASRSDPEAGVLLKIRLGIAQSVIEEFACYPDKSGLDFIKSDDDETFDLTVGDVRAALVATVKP